MDAARLAHRHQEALSIAEHCAEVLQKQFGAKRGHETSDTRWDNRGLTAHHCFLKTCYRTQMNTAAFALGLTIFTETHAGSSIGAESDSAV